MLKRSVVFLSFCAVALTFGIADAQVGPDVTVSNTGNIATYGTVGGITGYAASTTSCNRGDMVAEWIANTNQHPLIGQQMYRLMDGRFEQIGMNWLKHSFCAVNENSCGNCQDTPCDTLGIGCADTYSTGLNGAQADLGPRSDVQPYTADYQFPFPTQGQTGDAIYKRLQIAVNDLDPASNPGAQYFNEIVYITTDELDWGNQNNNTSYREVVVGADTPQGYDLGYTGPTVEEGTALDAWQSADPGVGINVIDVPNDGRIHLGFKATSLAGNLWHYEYVLYNKNSNRGAQSFSVPVPPGVALTNIEFHDVDYHSGEPYSGTDWSATQANGLLTWETQTFAQNPNANALRWATAYTFRFDADAQPQDVNSVVGLFVPGTPSSMTIPTIGPESAVVSADFVGSPTEGGSPLVVNFTSTSGGQIDTYEWDFGDGGTATEQNPTHVFNAEGLYTVTLTVTGPTGDDTEVKVDYIDAGPVLHTLTVADASAFAGANVTIPMVGGTPTFLSAYSASLSYPTDLLAGVDFHIIGSTAEENGAEFVNTQIDDVNGSMTLEVIMDLVPLEGIVLPGGFNQNFGTLVFLVDGTFADGETRELEFQDGLGAVPVDNVFVTLTDVPFPPATTNATLTFFNQTSFVRGNCDGVGSINLVDALLILNVIFIGAAPPDCLKACDYNDSGTLSLPDGIGVLFFLFASGPPPEPPFPDPGVDPTPDNLPCF